MERIRSGEGERTSLTRRVIFVGIPGVGKTKIISDALDILKSNNLKAEHVTFGTLMFNEAAKMGVKSRDEIRRLPIEDQKLLQLKAAKSISSIQTEILFVDTHLFINTPEGYSPGLPRHILEALSPTNLVLIEASPDEIRKRRINDKTRYRDDTSQDIEKDLNLGRSLISASGMLLGVPFMILENKEGKSVEAAEKVLKAIGVG